LGPFKKRTKQTKMNRPPPRIGAAVSHVVAFANEGDPGVMQTNTMLLQAVTANSILVFSFEQVLLDATGNVPVQLCNILSALSNLGLQLYAISRCTQASFVSKFPTAVNTIHNVHSRHPQETFTRLYEGWRARRVVLFGSENLIPSVLEAKRDGDVFLQLGQNYDERGGNLSYLEEILALVLLVKAGESITSLLLD
jgi:hypothetical protein